MSTPTVDTLVERWIAVATYELNGSRNRGNRPLQEQAKVEEGDLDPLVDMGIMDSIAHYFLYGWHPGGCAWAILAGDEEAAMRSAHIMTKPHVRIMIALMRELLPRESAGSYERQQVWSDHNGFSGAPAGFKTYFKLGHTGGWLSDKDFHGVLKGAKV